MIKRVLYPEQLIASALEHRLGSYLLHATMDERIPLARELQRILAASELFDQVQQRRQTKTFQRIVKRLDAADIPIGVFKGIDAQRRWWPPGVIRPSSDIDLFMRPADRQRFHVIQRLVAGDSATSTPDITAFVTAGVVRSATIDVAGVEVDLHADPFNLITPIETDTLWQASTASERAGVKVHVMSAEYALAHNAVNTLREGFPLLSQFVDVLGSAYDRTLDWDNFNDTIEREGIHDIVRYSLTRVFQHLDLEPPQGVQRSRPLATFYLSHLYPKSKEFGGPKSQIINLPSEVLLPAAIVGKRWRFAKLVARRLVMPAGLLKVRSGSGEGSYVGRLARYRRDQWLTRRSHIRQTPSRSGNLAWSLDLRTGAGDVVVHDFAGHPFQIDLSRQLANSGHAVRHLYCSTNLTPRASFDGPTERNLTIVPLSLGREFSKYQLRRRLADEVSLARLVIRELRRQRPGVLVSSNVPVVTNLITTAWCRWSQVRSVFWVQDLQFGLAEQQAAKTGSSKDRIAASVLATSERLVARLSSALVLITEDFLPVVRAWGIPNEAVHVIPNWAPLSDLPRRPKANEWSAAAGLGGDFVFLYSGTLGVKHDPQKLLALASQHRHDGAKVVVVSEGASADWLQVQAERLGLSNLSVLPFQPFEAMPDVLASADVLVCLLEADASAFSVPSKLLTYLCAARPVLASLPAQNQASRLLRNASCGLSSDAQDLPQFLRHAMTLRSDAALRERLGQGGLSYALSTFDIEPIAQTFGEILGLPETRSPSEARRHLHAAEL